MKKIKTKKLVKTLYSYVKFNEELLKDAEFKNMRALGHDKSPIDYYKGKVDAAKAFLDFIETQTNTK